MEKSLVDIAKENTKKGKNSRDITPEIKKLVMAYFRDEVSINACAKALGIKHGMHFYVTISRTMKKLFREGRLKIS